MTPFPPSQFCFIPLVEGDQDQSHLLEIPPFSIPTDTSSVPYPILFNNPQIQGANDRDHHLQQQVQLQQQQVEHKEHLMIQGSSDHLVSFPTINANTNNTVEQSLCNEYIREDQDQHRSGKWMSSKMRFMRKMMNPDGIIMRKPRRNKQFLQDQQPPPPRTQESSSSNTSNNNSINGGIIRVCSDCNTTKTPLWRSGPSGPKSLCNACGIRQRKARRAMAAAAVSGGLFPAVTPRKIQKEKRADVDRTLPFKKRCRIAAARTAQKKICFDDIVISLSKSSAFHRVFPQDEKDAAILLMALSCGLICS